MNNRYVGDVNLRESLLIDKPPTQVLMEKKPMVKDSDIRSTIGGYEVERPLADAIVKSALERLKADETVQNLRGQRALVLHDLGFLLEKLKKKAM